MSKNVGFSEEQQPDLTGLSTVAPGTFRWLDKAELQAFGHKADAWLEANKDIVEALATGTYVLIEVDTGGHVTGTDRDAARAEFDRRFGASIYSFVHRVRMPTTVGGGWWALHSGA
jgi:hypothetical protein